ncbi:MAG: prepilin-type N-terminal cleavage/methylation domain-containing protein [Candidatus Omnitrophica bacterium]|nr:prepilin-type N-terminal cleavage/methylation domain-containing protein [Candidatus Omnitrophota bacterium]
MKKKAFTLIELMLTVMIIAILVSIAIPNYINTVERARAREARATLESIRAAEQSYAAERRDFIAPTNDAEWNAIGLENPNTGTNASWSYTVTTGPLNIQASRLTGPYALQTISLDENGVEAGTWGL